MAAFTLAHLSDPHLPPLPDPQVSELLGKRALGYLNWTRNRHKYHRRDVLDVLVSDMQAQVPGHIAVTGDLVNLALEAEFAPALAWLRTVGPPDRVTAIPGNHDAYVRATRHSFVKNFADYLSGDDASGAAFPFTRRRGPLLLQTLSRLAHDDAFRVLLVHHPLRSASKIKRLTDAPELLALLKRYGVDLVLHGHDHVHSTIWIDGPSRTIPVVGVPSASARAHGDYPAAAYNLFSIARDGAAWRCQQMVRGIDDKLQAREIRRTRLI